MYLSFSPLIATAWIAMAASAVAAADENNNNVIEQRDLQSMLCRCEASWESFYNRRNLREQDEQEAQRKILEVLSASSAGDNETKQRSLYYHFDYTGAQINNDGYFVIEGVTVVPCNGMNRRQLDLKEEEEEASSSVAVSKTVNENMNLPVVQDEDKATDEGTKLRGLTYYYRSKGMIQRNVDIESI